MNNKTVCRFAVWFLLLPFIQAIPAVAQGDSVMAQVADGTGADGTQFITKFRITHLTPDTGTEIKKLKVLFFLQNGSPWTIATNLGTDSSFPLDLGSYQTFSLDTLGTAATQTSGYAIVRNTDITTLWAEDFQVAITAFYEVRKNGVVIDEISVPVSQPTLSFVLPVELDTPTNLMTGFAIVNLSSASNAVKMSLFQTSTPATGPAPSGPTTTITLNPNEQRAAFLPSFFPQLTSFKGTLVAQSAQPVAIVALLQTPTYDGVRYATLVPAYIDALRRNTYVFLRQDYSLDVDRFVVDYWWPRTAIDSTTEPDIYLPWDLVLETVSNTSRRLTARSGAQFAVIGVKTSDQFDTDLTVEYLQGLSYNTNPIDMSDTSSNLQAGFAFAVKTGLGRYAKLRIGSVISRTDDQGNAYKDLALEVFLYK